MLDWPEQIHTSPTKMLDIVTLESPEITKSLAILDAFNGSNFSIHFPLLSAFVFCFWLAKVTVILELGFAIPQTGTGMSRCKTIPSENKLAGFNSCEKLILN